MNKHLTCDTLFCFYAIFLFVDLNLLPCTKCKIVLVLI